MPVFADEEGPAYRATRERGGSAGALKWLKLNEEKVFYIMRIANLAGRATIVTEGGLIDVATASNGAFSTSVDKCLTQLDTLRTWYQAAQPEVTDETTPDDFFGDRRLGPVVTSPQQIFAIGLNYRHHANEMKLTLPSEPMVFTKFASSLCGPNDELPVRGETTDFEAELVVVIGSVRDLEPRPRS